MKNKEYVKPQTEVISIDSHCMVVKGSQDVTTKRGGNAEDEDPNCSRRQSFWTDDEYW